jgi:hypothetical protein
MSSVMDDTSGAGPVGVLPPLEQAASAATEMAAIRQYLSLLMSRMGSPLITANERNEPTCCHVRSLLPVLQILTSPNIDVFE